MIGKCIDGVLFYQFDCELGTVTRFYLDEAYTEGVEAILQDSWGILVPTSSVGQSYRFDPQMIQSI
jgi:hypothetical protein